MKKITIGIIAHVDSGKTTLSEALLYATGSIRNFGRVDKGASFLDNDQLERKRGITIFSKQARFEYGNTSFVLIDTPGHADFSAETERTLKILDYCILIISAKDGIKGQTKVLWNLLKEYKIPAFIFINKMDLYEASVSNGTDYTKSAEKETADFESTNGQTNNETHNSKYKAYRKKLIEDIEELSGDIFADFSEFSAEQMISSGQTGSRDSASRQSGTRDSASWQPGTRDSASRQPGSRDSGSRQPEHRNSDSSHMIFPDSYNPQTRIHDSDRLRGGIYDSCSQQPGTRDSASWQSGTGDLYSPQTGIHDFERLHGGSYDSYSPNAGLSDSNCTHEESNNSNHEESNNSNHEESNNSNHEESNNSNHEESNNSNHEKSNNSNHEESNNSNHEESNNSNHEKSNNSNNEIYDKAAMCSEEAMDEYLETGRLSINTIKELILKRKLFPCFFGAALKIEGVDTLLNALDILTAEPDYPEEFSARAYKISHDKDGSRLTFVKITGGNIKTKALLSDGDKKSKIDQIRFYSGEKFVTADHAAAGDICAFTGLSESYSGQGFGTEEHSMVPVLTPVLSFRAQAKDGRDSVTILPYFKILSEESPELDVSWDEDTKDIYVNVMGQIQLEILTSIMKERFDTEVIFDSGRIVYKETISKPVIGVGHFEPLRHYAEVHLLMEPLDAGSGLVFESKVSSDKLAKNWQRLIISQLSEYKHRGVLTGSAITDMKITLIAGKAHLKHTEGGDFRQAAFRAVRQGLMMTENVLLEPFYRFRIEVPSNNAGRVLNDLDRMNAEFQAPDINGEKNTAVVFGRGPVSQLKDYASEIAAFSKGQGSISFTADGYGPCSDAEDVILEMAYDPARDVRNPADSVFCSHGAGHIIPYDEVYDHMHLELDGTDRGETENEITSQAYRASERTMIALGTDEVDQIISAASGANRAQKGFGNKWKRDKAPGSRTKSIYNGSSWSESDGFTPSVIGGEKTINRSGFEKKRNGTKLQKMSGDNDHMKSRDSLKEKKKLEKVPKYFQIEEADCLLVDGYNVIFAWDDLKELAKENIDAARDSLVEILKKYAAMTESYVLVVFDAYKARGHLREVVGTMKQGKGQAVSISSKTALSKKVQSHILAEKEKSGTENFKKTSMKDAKNKYVNIKDINVKAKSPAKTPTSSKVDMVYTREGETADMFIERFANMNSGKMKLAVVTSDRVEQVITSAQGSRLISSREFKQKIDSMTKGFNEKYHVTDAE